MQVFAILNYMHGSGNDLVGYLVNHLSDSDLRFDVYERTDIESHCFHLCHSCTIRHEY